MKRKCFFTMIIAMVLVFVGCSKEVKETITDTGITNDISVYQDYSFWAEPNTLTVYTSPSINISSKAEEDYEFNNTKELTTKHKKEIEELREGIINYFNKNYGIDVTEKIQKQKVRTYRAKENDNSVSMGCVDPKNSDILNINELVFEPDYKAYFANIYIHETLHQLGFIDMSAEHFIDGLADALADMILCSMGRESYTTPNYFESRTLAYQILAVDKELPSLYLGEEKFSISKRITERLEDVERTHNACKKPGTQFIKFTTLLFANNMGNLQCSNDPAVYAFDAQAIMFSYCKTFNPDEKTIDYLRAHYLYADFEKQKKAEANIIE